MGWCWFFVAVSACSLLACGQVRSEAPQREPDTADAGASAGGAPAAPLDSVVCDEQGQQLARAADGSLAPTGLRCTVRVLVDDETGAPCAVKADGSYRCWSEYPFDSIPEGDYQQVQLGYTGLIGLTRAGQVVAPSLVPLPQTEPIIELTSTNMGGYRALCYRTAPAGPFIVRRFGDPPPDTEFAMQSYEGPFVQATCVYEGLAYAVRSDGSIWSRLQDEVPAGNDFVRVAGSIGSVCGLTTSGQPRCVLGFVTRRPPCPYNYCITEPTPPAPPVFPSGVYTQLAVSWSVSCGITDALELVCIRADSSVIPTPPGRYTAVAAGSSTVCAIRVDGTSACWSEQTGGAAAQFVDYSPSIDSDW